MEQNFSKLFGHIWGQCTPALQQDVAGDEEYEQKCIDFDCLWLLQKLKKCSSGADGTQYKYLAFIRCIRTLVTIRQQEQESLQKISDRLSSSLQSFKLLGGNLHPEELVNHEMKSDGTLTKDDAKYKVENKLMGIILIEAANDKKFGELKRSLQKSMA